MDFDGETESKASWLAVVNHTEFLAIEALQAVTAELQSVASGPMTAERWTDD